MPPDITTACLAFGEDLHLHMDRALVLALCGLAARLLVLWHHARAKR